MDKLTRVVVVGGGIAGLVAANTAADKGAAVTLLEGGGGFGGRALTQIRDGYHFNLGPHALYKKAAGAPILKQLGIHPDGKDAPLDGSLAIFENHLFPLPTNTSSLLRTRVLSLKDKLETMKILSGLGKLDTGFYKGIPFSETVKQLTARPRVQLLLCALARLSTYSHAPELMCGAAVLDQLQAGNAGVLYLHKGWQSLIASLEQRAREKGVVLRNNVKVCALSQNRDEYTLRDKAARTWAADSVVLAISPDRVDRLIGPWSDIAASDAFRVPIHLASLDIGLSSLPNPSRRFALGLDEPVYFSVHSATVDLAPPGGALIHVSRYMGKDENFSPKAVKAELEAVADLLQPGWRDFIAHQIFRPGLTVSHAIPMASRGGLSGRMPVASPDRPNLYFAGDWIGSSGLLADAAIASGADAGAQAANTLTRKALFANNHTGDIDSGLPANIPL